VAVALTLLMLFFAEPFLLTFGASENTIGYAMDYMQIYMFGTVFVQMSLGLNAFITAQGFAKVSMKTTLIGAITNIILDPVFIFFFGMGVKGAALATVISQMLSAVWVLHFLTGKKTILKLQKKNLRLEAKTILPCVLLGLSPFVMQSTESILNICFNSSLLKYGGDMAVGAMTILGSVMQFSILPLSGLCQGAQPITGYNFGAGKGDRVRESFGILLKSSVIYTTALWLIVMIFPRQVAMLFAGDGAFLDYTVWALRIYMALSLLMGVQLACQQTFIAIGNAKTSLFLAIYRKIILLIPLIYILPRFFEKKDMAVFLAEPVADFVAVTTTAILFARQFKRAMKELEN
jgi:putative MATE family efflux protein